MHTAIGQYGGCQCGKIRYRLAGMPRMLYVCHCRDCQKQSASAFGMSLILARKYLVFTEGGGQLKTWDTRGDDGRIKRCAFCPDCGTRIYHGTDDPDDDVSIKAGSLDDTKWLRPVAHIWLDRAQPWVPIDGETLACFGGEPDDESEIEQRWQAQSRPNDT